MKGTHKNLTSLRIFEAAARTLNFSRTAEEHHLTQGAISKHIAGLEKRLGTVLFKRTPTGLRLTHAGALYLEKISAALRLLDEADATVAHPGSRVALNIAVSPSFAPFLLIGRLAEFFNRHPDIRVNIRPRLIYGRPAGERFDAEIQLHTGHISGKTAQYLCGREMTLVAAPSLLERRPVRGIDDLQHLPLLKRAQRGYGWDEWRAEIAPHWAGPGQHASEYEGFSLLLPATLHGLGLAIVPICLVLEHLRAGRLVRPLGEVVAGRHAYYLLQPRPDTSGPCTQAFCDWIREESQRVEDAVQDYLAS